VTYSELNDVLKHKFARQKLLLEYFRRLFHSSTEKVSIKREFIQRIIGTTPVRLFEVVYT